MNTVTTTVNPAPTAPTTTPTRTEATWLPAVDVLEDAGGITVLADLPGVPREKLQLHVDGDQLTLEGEIAPLAGAGLSTTHAEVGLPRLRRAFTLSKELDASRIEADLSQGVLRVRIPRLAAAQARRIEVR